MKTELERFTEQQGLTYDSKTKVMYGLYKGYKIEVKEDIQKYRYYFNIPMKSADFIQGNNINGFIQNLLQDEKLIKRAVYEGYSLKLEVTMSRVAKNNNNRLMNLLDQIVIFARDNSYDSCCEVCGEDISISAYLINDSTFYGCEDCYNKTISNLDAHQTHAKSKKGSFVTGIVGALLGSLIGVALWVTVYAIGYIAAICGIVLAVCAIKGYELFGGKLDLLGIISTMLITIIMVYIATYLSYGYSIYDTFRDTEEIDIFTAIRSVRDFITDYPEIQTSFYTDLAKGYLFTVIGSVSTFISAYRTSNGSYTAKKLAN